MYLLFTKFIEPHIFTALLLDIRPSMGANDLCIYDPCVAESWAKRLGL